MAYIKHMSVEEVQRRARSGPLMLLSRRGASLLIGLLSTFTIARLLSPRDYGLAAMSTVVLAFSQSFRDFGLTNATLRKGHIEEHELTFLFWFNVISTVAIAAVIAVASPFIADFYSEPAVRDILLVSLVSFVVGGFSYQHSALLSRDLRFGMVAAVETISLAAGFAVGLAIAFIWRNYWAIVASNLVRAIVSSAIILGSTRWKPGRPQMIPEAMDLLKFGANSTFYSLLNFLSRYASTLIIGKALGAGNLGHFNRAYDLYQLPFNNLLRPIAQVTLPVLARLRKDPVLYRNTYLNYVERLSCTLVPACVVLTFIGVPLVHVLLGSKWTIAGQLLAILAPGLAVYGVIYPIPELMVSQSRSDDLRRIGFWDLGLRLVGILIGVFFGLKGAAYGFMLGTVAMMPVRITIAGRKGPVTRMDLWRAMLPSVPVGLGVAIGCVVGKYIITTYLPGGDVWQVAVIGGWGFIGMLAGGLSFRRSRHTLREVIAMLTGRYKVA